MSVLSPAVSDLAVLICSTGPELHPGVYAYGVVPRGSSAASVCAAIQPKVMAGPSVMPPAG